MQFVYKPEGVEPRKWDFEPDRLMSPEAEAIERHTKWTFAEWADAVTRGSVLALHALLFVMLKRDHPTLKWEDVQFSMSELDFEISDEDHRNAIEQYEAREADLTDDERATLETLKAQLADPEQEPAPKD